MARNTSSIATRLTLSGEKEFNNKLKEISSNLALTDANLQKTAAAYDLNGDAQKKLETESQRLVERIKANESALQLMNERLAEAKEKGNLSAKGMRDLEIAAAKTETEITELNKVLRSAYAELDKASGKELEITIDTSRLNELAEASGKIDGEMRMLSSDLRVLAGEFDLNGDKADYLSNKSRLLSESIRTQKEANDVLAQSLAETKQQYGQNSKEFQNAYVKYNEGKLALSRLEKQVEDTDRELEELGRDSRRAGNQLEDNLGEAADDVTTKFERMVGSINDSLTDIRNMQGVSLAVDLVRGAWNVGSQAYQWAQGYSQENMKTAMAQYNVQTAGGNWEQTARLAIQYASIFGDKDSALEAISNLTAAGYTDQSLEKMAQYLGGAAIRWQDTLKIESLADSLQESLAEGVLTGQFAELINRLAETTGITQEQVAAQLAEAKRYGQEKEAIEAYLENAGLSQVYEGFADQNQAMIDAATAAGELNQEMADLANEINILITPAVKLLAGGLKDLNETIELWKNEDLTTEEKVIKSLTPTKEEWEKGLNVVGVDYQTGMKAIDAYSQWAQNLGTSFGEWIQGKKKGASTTSGKGAVGYRFDEVATVIDNETGKAAEAATEGGTKIGSSLWAGLQSQTAQLLAIAQQQRTLLEAVWEDPITPTVVVSYGTAPGATGGKPNLPTLPSSVNVTVELDKRKVGEAVVDFVDQALGGATGAATDKIY